MLLKINHVNRFEVCSSVTLNTRTLSLLNAIVNLKFTSRSYFWFYQPSTRCHSFLSLPTTDSAALAHVRTCIPG